LYADEKRHARESDVKKGDMVVLKQERKNKLTPTFGPEPYLVMDMIGNSVRKFLERSNMPDNQISASPVTSDNSTERQPQPSVKGSDGHSGETRTKTAAENTAEPDSNENIVPRPVRSRKLPERFKIFVIS